MQYFVVNIRTTTFNLPDFRGAFLRMVGDNSASVGTLQEDAIRNISGVFSSDITMNKLTGPFYQYGTFSGQSWDGWASGSKKNIGFNASRVVPTADENRPVNYAVQYFIKY